MLVPTVHLMTLRVRVSLRGRGCGFFHRHGASLSRHTLYRSLCVSSPFIRPLVDVRLVSKEDTHERNELKSLSKDFV